MAEDHTYAPLYYRPTALSILRRLFGKEDFCVCIHTCTGAASEIINALIVMKSSQIIDHYIFVMQIYFETHRLAI